MNSTKALLAGIVSAALVLGIAPSAGANGRTDPCYDKPCPVDVLSVTDGDTVVLAGYGSVRLIGIDSPEMEGWGGPEAKSNLESIVSQGGVGIWADTNQPDRDR